MRVRLGNRMSFAAMSLAVLLATPMASADAATPTDFSIRAIGGSLRTGRLGRFTVTVRNRGPAATDADVHVLVTLPPDISFVEQRRLGWECTASGQTVDCVRHDPIGLGRASSLSLVLAVCSTELSVDTTFQVAYAGDANPTNDTAIKTKLIHPGQCVAGTPTPSRTAGTPSPTRTPTVPGAPTNTPTAGTTNPDAPVITSFTCNGATQCTLAIGQSFTIRFSFTDANANAVSYRMTARDSSGSTSVVSSGTFGGPTAGQTITLNFSPFTCPVTPCHQEVFDFTLVVTDSTNLNSLPATVPITVLASG